MEVVGRHALLFDDDATSGFVNSREALVEWNSLLIDRYDVRHLLHSPPPPLLKRRRHSSSDQESSEIDQIRYQDLPPTPHQENIEAEAADGNPYRAVPFSYGNIDVSSESKHSEVPGFLPPFPVPESLLQHLPHTEKLHQIMARTAIFVSGHGAQSEIVLRVKQGNNPTFGFLMPDHHLHAYFRFLVDHPEVVKSDSNTIGGEFKKVDQEQKQTDVTGEALSLLGSIYGSGEDEDVAGQIISEFKDNEPGNAVNATTSVLGHGSECAVSSGYSAGFDLATPKHPYPADKEKAILSKKVHSISALASTTAFSKKKEGRVLGSLPNSSDKSRANTSPSASVTEPLIVEPPSEIKKTMDKIIEFVMKNGKEFEAVLIQQDQPNGRFPFLLPSNQYHPYYLKSIQKAQESKQAGKKDIVAHASSKKSKDTDILSNGSASYDLPFDSERKEKFKMVITSSKKDAQESIPKPNVQQCGMSVDAAAAILQAATRGLRNPKLEVPLNTSFDDTVQSADSEGGPASSFGTRSSSQMHSSSKPVSKDEPSVSIPIHFSVEAGGAGDVSVAKAIAKSASLAAATEADSSEASLTKEQKQKAERLKRAKMFAAIIKSGAVPQKTSELLPRLSAEPQNSGCKTESKDGYLQVPASFSLPDVEVVNIIGREREGDSVSLMASSDRMEKSRKGDRENDYNEEKSRKRHHSSSRRLEEDDIENREHKHSRKKHHSHHSSRHSKGEHRHSRKHSSTKGKESRHRHNHHRSSEDEQCYTNPLGGHRKSHSKMNAESEDDNNEKVFHESNRVVSCKSASGETSVELINDRWEGSTPLVEAQSSSTQSVGAEPSDELRAKVRAMLLATM